MYPFDEEPAEGYFTEDVDRDGRILWMRIADPNGPYKPHPDEPRLMIRRDPAEAGGTYYRLLPEGRPVNYDGYLIRQKRPPQGLDINRNFPVDWEQEGKQLGSGPYPVSEPEVRAVVDFISRHNNITGAVSFHTFSAVILRPYGHLSDENFPPEDLWNYQKIGDKGTEITGYPNVSVYHDFRYHPKDSIKGVFDDWVYDHRGAFGWTVELWSPIKQAGITDYKFMDWFREHPVEDDLTLLRWNDEKLGGRGYVDWREFDHPDLGRVEIGGWDMAYCWRNPPPDYLEQEIAAFPKWLLWHALISPRLEITEASATPLGEGAFLVRLVVENSGWLPAYVTKKALEKNLVRGLICEIDLPEGASLETGKLREEFGQLEGRSHMRAHSFLLDGSNTNRLKVEWVVRAPQGGSVRITARHDRAGTVRAEVALG
jgi:murein tripeptide amidase MpaA